MNTAILTYCDKNFEWELIHDFLYTLRKTIYGNYKGQVTILDYGLTPKAIKKSKKYANIVRCEKLVKVEANRNRDLPKIIKALHVDTVMTIDAGDVWFQERFDEVFQKCSTHIGYVEEDMRCDGEWMSEKIEMIKDERYKTTVKETLQDKKMIGSGMLCGPKDKMIALLQEAWKFTKDANEDFFGIDQIAINMVIRLWEKKGGKFISLPKTYDYVIITNKYETFYENGIIYDKHHNRAKIVHNAGRKEYKLINRREDRCRKILQQIGLPVNKLFKRPKYMKVFLTRHAAPQSERF